jgi:5-methylthioadenosine/S-adenosylhomocysteine deaminase
MQEIDLCLSPGWIITLDAENTTLKQHSILIKDGKIVTLVTQNQCKNYAIKKHLKLPNHVLMPGLVNAHAHSPMTLLRGLGDDTPLRTWLSDHIWPAENALLNPAMIRDGTEIACAEMLLSGTTCFSEHYFYPQMTAQCVQQIGLRAQIGLWVGETKTAYSKDAPDCLQMAKQQLKKGSPSNLINYAMAPHSPYLTSDPTLVHIHELCQEYSINWHMHLHESAYELQHSLEHYGKRPIQRLYDLGILSPKFQAVHMAHISAEDWPILEETRPNTIHCPASNLKLASGLAPISTFLEKGLNVSLGTDGAASNNTLNMFHELRLASLLAKGISEDPCVIPAKQALRMATINGAKTLGIAQETGSLEIGKAADMIAINLDDIRCQPAHDPYLSTVYTDLGSLITDVWVAGRQLVAQGQLTTLDIETLRDKAKRWAKKTQRFASLNHKTHL